jgi:hypothetical protein
VSTQLQSLVEQSPKELEHNLVVAMRAVAHRTTGRAEVARALAAAEQLKAGLVISTEAEAARVADLVRQVLDGESFLTEQRREAEHIPQQMVKAIRAVIAEPEAVLAAAKKVGNDARVQYQQLVRRRAAEEEKRLREEAEARAREAAEAAEAAGEDIPPPVDVGSLEVPRTVAGGTGKMGTQVRIVATEVVDRDLALTNRDWFQFSPEAARASFQAAERAGNVKRPAPGESVLWWGVRFEARESAVNRR